MTTVTPCARFIAAPARVHTLAFVPYLRMFRGVHKAYLACYLAVFEAIRNAKRVTPELVQRLCFGTQSHTSYR